MPTRTPSPKAQFTAMLARFPPKIISLVKKSLTKLRRAFPVNFEIVYDYGHSLVLSFSMTEKGYEAIIALAIFQEDVKLYFDKSLPDPKKVLKGTGTKVRSLSIALATDIDKEDIQALIHAAIQKAGVAFPEKASTKMIIQTQSKKTKTPKA